MRHGTSKQSPWVARSLGRTIMASCRSQHSHALQPLHYRELLRKEHLADIVAYLKGSQRYAPYLANLSEREFDRATLKAQLHQSLLATYIRAYRYDSNPHSFYRWPLMELEVELLAQFMDVLSRGATHVSCRFGLLHRDDLQFYLLLNLRRLRGVDSAPKLREQLAGSPYAKVLEPFLRPNLPQLPHLEAEAALRRFFAQTTLQSIAQLPVAADRHQLHVFFSRYLELGNCLNLFRMKGFPGYDADRVRRLLDFVPSAYLKERDWQKLVAVPDQPGFLGLFGNTSLGRMMSDEESSPLLGSWLGLAGARLLYRQSQQMLRLVAEGPSTYMAHVMLFRQEVQNLVSIIEGNHYRLPPEHTASLLVY